VLIIISFFTDKGVLKSGLSPTIDIIEVVSDTLVVSGAAMTALTNMTHCYYYNFAAFDNTKEYAVTVDGGAVLNNIDRYQFAKIDDVWNEIMEGSLSARKFMRIILSALAGKTTGGGSATFTSRDLGDTKARITMTVDANENRISITLDGD
jgi:hypothetical protein